MSKEVTQDEKTKDINTESSDTLEAENVNEDQELEGQSEVTEEDEFKNETELKIEKLEEELEAANDAMLRKAAELENVKKRVQRERIQIFQEAKAGALEDFMPINDDLIRTLQAAEESKIEDSFLEGVRLIANKFNNVLEKHGVERIDEEGVPFNVNLHDAMMKQKAPNDKTESDMVLQVIESGYKIGDRIIKHAKVIVSE